LRDCDASASAECKSHPQAKVGFAASASGLLSVNAKVGWSNVNYNAALIVES
jgi:hypothetical protein